MREEVRRERRREEELSVARTGSGSVHCDHGAVPCSASCRRAPQQRLDAPVCRAATHLAFLVGPPRISLAGSAIGLWAHNGGQQSGGDDTLGTHTALWRSVVRGDEPSLRRRRCLEAMHGWAPGILARLQSGACNYADGDDAVTMVRCWCRAACNGTVSSVSGGV